MNQGDAISRSAVLAALPKETELLRYQVVDTICNTPALSVSSTAHYARWIDYGLPDDDGNVECKCSRCYACDIHGTDRVVPFCWNCGAKMDETKKEIQNDRR